MSTKPRPDCRPRHSLTLILLLSLSLFTIPAPPLGRTAPAAAGLPAAHAPHAPAPPPPAQEAALTSHLNVYAVNDANQLLRFRSDTPGTIDATIPITGLAAGEQISALDFSPLTGLLYGVGITNPGPGDDAIRLYRIDARTGAATLLNTLLGMPDGAFYGLDIDSRFNGLRLVSSVDQNFRFNPDTGNLIAVDTSLNDPAGAETVVGLAYDRSVFDSNTRNTLFGIDTSVNRLVRVGDVDGTPASPNGGVLTAVGPLGVQIGSNHVGFDIAGVDAAYASMQSLLSGSYNLYTVNLTTGAAAVVGAIGNGSAVIRGIAVQPPPEIVVINTNNIVPGALRFALIMANNLPGPNTITFNIPGPGPHIIAPTNLLPTITDPVTIDATTQPGYAGVPLVEITGLASGDLSGLVITAGSSTVRGLAINRFGRHGIELRDGDNNVITGCRIGTNAAGTAALPNGGDGISISGGSNGNRIGGLTATPGTGEGNVISGNNVNGITISGNPQTGDIRGDNVIIGNVIGSNAAGTARILPNLVIEMPIGVYIENSSSNTVGGSTPQARNIISGNQTGVHVAGFYATSNRILGNYIGTDINGTASVFNVWGVIINAPLNFVGGPNPGEGNVISGNTGFSLWVVTEEANTIQGNLIGPDKTGTARVGNGRGVLVETQSSVGLLGTRLGGTTPGARNVISGNSSFGVSLSNARDTHVQGNYIGTDITGTNPLGNDGPGLVIQGQGRNFVGDGNVIAFNAGPGVNVGSSSVRTSTLNTIRLNSIHSNGGLGIDLIPEGLTPNDPGDADTGANNLQNFPVLTAATSAASGPTTVQGSLNSTPNTPFFLDFYATNAVEPGGVCEGQTYLGTSLLTTDAGGNVPLAASFSVALPPGTHVTATATTANSLVEGDTSEFSPCVAVSSTGPTPTPTPTPTPGTATLQLSAAAYRANEDAGFIQVTVTRTGDLNTAAAVDYATTDGTANDRGDYTTSIGRLRFAAGENARSFLVFLTDDRYVEGEESFQLALSNPTGGAALGSTAAATLTINDNDDAPSPDNPADLTAFFVRQHYIDFLNRAPDPDGFAFWVSNIETCGSDAQCREVKRIDTSAAFFLSIEFERTGFLVHRLYRAGLKRFPRYREFIRDARELGRGVVVGRAGWETQLEANQGALAAEFAARAEFVTAHGALTNEQFVDALNVNTGGALSTAERDALVAGLNGGTETRAGVLLKVAEDADFTARERNPAFVLAQYFGYLRRNPDDPPDADFGGFQFWLTKLDQFGGDYRKAELVRAFILSTEYRSRFGQP